MLLGKVQWRQWHRWLPPSAFLGSLLLTALATFFATQFVATNDSIRFNNVVQQTADAIHRRMSAYEDLLLVGAGIYAAAGDVSAQEFRAYVNRLQLQERYPGIQGVGFIARVPAREKESFEKTMQRQVSPAFRIWPEGQRDDYYAVIYLEPLDERNRRVIGFDTGTEPTRRLAMDRARDTGQPAASQPVRLVQETNVQSQAGLVVYVPVYRGGHIPAAVEERRKALQGFVCGVFRGNDLLAGIFQQGVPPVDFRVFLGSQGGVEHLLAEMVTAPPPARALKRMTINVVGQPWAIEFFPGAYLRSTSLRFLAPLTFFAGLIVSLMLFLSTLAQSRAHRGLQQVASNLEESEERYRTMAETAADGIVSIDERSIILSANPATERIFGYPVDELIGRTLTILMPERFRDAHRRGLERFLTTGAKGIPWNGIELPGLRKDGTEIPVEISFGFTRQEGKPVFSGFIRDISERKRAQEALVEANETLERRVEQRTAALREINEQLQSFTYSVAHDLRAPLRAITGYSQTLLDEKAAKLDGDVQKMLAKVLSATARMDTLIADLLDYSQLNTAQLTLEPVALARVLERTLAAVAHDIERTGAQVDIDGPLPVVRAHPPTLEAILLNLVSNAIKFVPPNVKPSIQIWAGISPSCVRLSIRDNGIGIAPEYHDRIFGVFERLHRAAEYPGTGIGLAIVRKGMERMGGTCGLESAPGQGSTFWIELPILQDEEAGADTEPQGVQSPRTLEKSQ